MNREIKFRGKSLQTGEWVYGCCYTYKNTWDKPIAYILETNRNPWDLQPIRVDPITLGQYTGLKDRRCVEIYEDDIIRISGDYEENIYVVKYFGDQDYPAFDTEPHIDCDSNGLSYAMAVCEVDVIGNAHDTHELLEGSIMTCEVPSSMSLFQCEVCKNFLGLQDYRDREWIEVCPFCGGTQEAALRFLYDVECHSKEAGK